MKASDQPYVLAGREADDEALRLAALEQVHNAQTVQHLEMLSVGPAWHCLEAAAGKGGIATWLADAVAPAGTVVATDVDTRFLRDLEGPNLQVLQHDITREELPAAEFDLAHVRLLLMHLTDPCAVVRKLVAALKPGGTILLEEGDLSFGRASDPLDRFDSIGEMFRQALLELARGRGVDWAIGGKLPDLLADAGLVEVAAEARASYSGSKSRQELELRTRRALAQLLVAEDLVSEQDVTAYLELSARQPKRVFAPVLISAWGKKPFLDSEQE